MWFAILGPLQILDGQRSLDVPGRRQRVLLAALLLRAGTPVPPGPLAEMVWDGNPPPGADVTLRAHVKRLRITLGPRAGARLVTRPGGYLLEAGEDEADVLRFRSLCRSGSAALRNNAWGRAHTLLVEAAELWRGEFLADIRSDSLRRDEGLDLEALRLDAEEWRIDAALHLGRHAEVVSALQSLTRQYPLREAFRGQLMLALYRSGRPAEALAAYQDAREALVVELGVEPGPGLRELQQTILSSAPALVPRPAESSEGGLQHRTPRDLPPAVRGFTGRDAELETLTRILADADLGAAGTVVISAIGGAGGVGKTALALHWAHQVAGRFGDGQLYVNLRGFASDGVPVTPAEAIRTFLDALGVPAERIPPAPDAQAALYRSLLAERKLLIVLDNARDEQQVRPLLPASPGSLVLVTSRNQLAGLAAADAARLVSLDVLPHPEAVQLLATRLGPDRAAAEPAALNEIASLCGHLPLALTVVAARAASRPSFALSALAAELRDSAGRLDVLDTGDPSASVREVFSWSYQQLSPEAARMFRLLGLHPGPDWTDLAAASLAARPATETRRLLRGLTRAHLISEHVPGRYAFHDLLRAYASDQARDTDDEEERDAATERILDYYLHSGAAAALVLSSSHEPVVLARPSPGTVPAHPGSYRTALAWFKAENQVLLAAVALAAESGRDTHAWQLPWAMTPFLLTRGHYQERAAILRTALDSGIRLGDLAAQAVSGRLLACARADLGDHDQAFLSFSDSLELYRRLGNRHGEARVFQNLTALHERIGRASGDRAGSGAAALRTGGQALKLFQSIGDKAMEAVALCDLGSSYALAGDYQRARACCLEALDLAQNPVDEALIWNNLSEAEYQLGDFSEAADCAQRALNIYRETDKPLLVAQALATLGDARLALGELALAREAWRETVAVLEDFQIPGADLMRAKLAVSTPTGPTVLL